MGLQYFFDTEHEAAIIRIQYYGTPHKTHYPPANHHAIHL